MKATGIVRRVDELWRIVIPKKICRTRRIREGDPLEIYTEKDGGVFLRKYSPHGELREMVLLHAARFLVAETRKDREIPLTMFSQSGILSWGISMPMIIVTAMIRYLLKREVEIRCITPWRGCHRQADRRYTDLSGRSGYGLHKPASVAKRVKIPRKIYQQIEFRAV